MNGLGEIVLAHPITQKDVYHIYLNNLSQYSHGIIFYIFFDVPDWAGELKSRHEILLQVVKLANALGVRFAFLTQLHMESFLEKQGLIPTHNTDKTGCQGKLNQFTSIELKRKENDWNKFVRRHHLTLKYWKRVTPFPSGSFPIIVI